jgi:nitrogen fixation protein FixH
MKLNWGFGIAVVYTLFAVCMILFAVKASQQHYDLVNDNYYNEAVNYQKKIDAGKNAALADSKLSIEYLAKENAIEISSVSKSNNINGTLSFYKPDKAGDDFQVAFSINESGKKLIPLKKLAHGYWSVNVAWNMNSKDCYSEKRIFVE